MTATNTPFRPSAHQVLCAMVAWPADMTPDAEASLVKVDT